MGNNKAFRQEVEVFENFIDCGLNSSIAAGWKPKMFRVVPKNAGFALEEFKASTDGKPFWKQIDFNTNKAEMERWMKKYSK